MLFVALLLAACSVLLVTRAVTGTPRAHRRLAHVAAYQALGRPPVTAAPEPRATGRDRANASLERLGARASTRFGGRQVQKLRTQLRGAGLYDVSPELFIGTQIVLTGAGIMFALWLSAAKGFGPVQVFGFVALTGYVGFALPISVVSRRSRLRLGEIDRELPELVDLLVVAVEAGLGLGAALDRGATHTRGPLADELRLVLQEQGLGATTHASLGQLVERNDSPAIRSFVRTLTQGDSLGVPVGQTMRAVALDIRKRRRAAAEELAQKAPIKVMFPLVFCIFPSLLVVILAPAALSLVGGFGA